MMMMMIMMNVMMVIMMIMSGGTREPTAAPPPTTWVRVLLDMWMWRHTVSRAEDSVLGLNQDCCCIICILDACYHNPASHYPSYCSSPQRHGLLVLLLAAAGGPRLRDAALRRGLQPAAHLHLGPGQRQRRGPHHNLDTSWTLYHILYILGGAGAHPDPEPRHPPGH